MKKIVIDTNILLQIAHKHAEFHYIFDDIFAGKMAMCITGEIMCEYEEILGRNNREVFANAIVNVILNLEKTVEATVYFKWLLITKDLDDNKFTDCAIACNADFIVSDDHHFDDLRNIPFPKVIVLKFDEFIAWHKKHIK